MDATDIQAGTWVDAPPGFEDIVPLRRRTSRDSVSFGAVPRNLTRLFIRGVPAEVTPGDLKFAFSQFGHVVSVKIPAPKRDLADGPVPYRMAFVSFANAAQADEARRTMENTQLRDRNGNVFEGTAITIDFSYSSALQPEAPPGFDDGHSRALTDPTRLFVRRLHEKATPEDLKAAFSQFGVVVNAIIPTDHDTGRSRGFGYVKFATGEEADIARHSMHGTQLHDRDGNPFPASAHNPKGTITVWTALVRGSTDDCSLARAASEGTSPSEELTPLARTTSEQISPASSEEGMLWAHDTFASEWELPVTGLTRTQSCNIPVCGGIQGASSWSSPWDSSWEPLVGVF